ncbi:hypothetical protein HZB60_07640 [candidate division KSB1 bacterium]|nr:hypothetical protein [candidate division KSB1 bacterium]
MNPSLYRRLALVLTTLPLLLLTSCDEPNTPDIPVRPYAQAAVFVTRGVAQDVAAKGDYVAIADDLYGTVVLNVADLNAIDSVFHYDNRNGLLAGEKTAIVALDLLHHYVMSGVDAGEIASHSDIHDFLSGERKSGINFVVPLRDLEFDSVDDTLKFWASDQAGNDGFIATKLCRENDQSNWSFSCDLVFAPYLPPRREIRGFGRNASVEFAIGIGEEGIHLHRGNVSESISTLEVPGIAYDCAWYGDYIIVAAQYGIVVVDATTRTAPVVAATLVVPSADRLQEIVVQGHYACVLDVNDGIYVYDISTPSAPEFVQLLDVIDPSALDADPAGNRLYVTDRGQGLVVFTK